MTACYSNVKVQLLLVSLQVKGQVVGTSKCTLTVRTLERLHSRVLAHVPGKLVRASELPVAAFPVALVRFLPGMGPLVCFEVRALGVDLGAAWVGAAVDTLVALGLGIVVHGIDQLIGTVLCPHGSCRKQLRKFLDGGARAGGGGTGRVVVERGGGEDGLGSCHLVLVRVGADAEGSRHSMHSSTG